MTVVDGKAVFQDGELRTVDERRTIQKCGESIKRLYAAAF